MRRAARRAMGGLLTITVAWSPLFAQRSSAVEAGAGAAYFTEDDRLVAGPWIRIEAQREVGGARARGEASALSGSGGTSAAASAATWWRGDLRTLGWWEAGGEGSALVASRLHSSTSLLGGVRGGRSVGGATSLWLRATTHVAWREAGGLRGYGLEAGSWWTVSFARISTSVLHQRAQAQLFRGTARDSVLGVLPVRYDEASFAISMDRAWGTVDAMAGARRDPGAPTLVEPMWRMSALLWQASTRAVSLNVTRQPPDFVHGADATYALSIGLRFAARPMATDDARTTRPVVHVVDSGSGDQRYLRARAPGARTVELMADFTGWESVAFERDGASRAGDEFILHHAMRSGTHHLMLRIDGGPWIPPANLPQLDDDYGGRVGILVVE